MAENWEYCPFCGSSIKEGAATRLPAFTGLEDLLADIDGEFRKMEDAFRSVWFDRKNLRPVGGISIRISSEESGEPKINVDTFGDCEEHARKIEERLGIMKARTPPKITREPKTLIERWEDKMVLRVEVPGVMSEDDIEIKRMAESVEIRAYAGDTAYFTLFCIPPDSVIISKRLENEELVIEVGNIAEV
ncbi:MAG: hypothetical protein V3R93_05575 [Candidatus Hydrothermarchaeaceae archaeon]